MSNQKLNVLFGTESGNSERIAVIAASLAKVLGYDSEVIDMANFDPADLEDWQAMMMVISTNGEGEMPINAEASWEEAQELELKGLKELQFAVLALGDTAYDYFCQAGIDWDEYLSSTGAKAICERGEVDAEYYEPSIEWLVSAFTQLSGKNEDEVRAALDKALSDAPTDSSQDDGAYSASNPWQAKVLDKRNLCAQGSSKAVRHYSLSLEGSDISYRPGGCIEVLPVNNEQLVERLIETMVWSGDEQLSFADGKTTLREALKTRFEIRQPTLKLLKLLSSQSTDGQFKRLVSKGSKADIEQAMFGHDVVSLIETYGRKPAPRTDIKSRLKTLFGNPQVYPRFDHKVFISYLKPLQARAYSIASSQSAYANEVHLTIADVEYEKDGRKHEGACSMYLAQHIEASGTVNCWPLPNKYFVLPEDTNTNIIMIGPGTGIAPFMGFLQERKVQNAAGKNWLFFGDRQSEYDFLYRDELEAFQNEGVLTRLDTAFSRDQQEKVYVQHKIEENAKELFEWLESGAIIYVCGDAKNMAKDVDAALQKVVATQGGLSEEDTRKYMKSLQKQQRYLKDVY